MFAKQQAVIVLNKASDADDEQLQRGKDMGLDEAAQAGPVRRSEKDNTGHHLSIYRRNKEVRDAGGQLEQQAEYPNDSITVPPHNASDSTFDPGLAS